jgi:hypothetical protein
MSTKITNLTNKAGETQALSLSTKPTTAGISPLKLSRIFGAPFHASRKHFISGTPGATRRLASCGIFPGVTHRVRVTQGPCSARSVRNIGFGLDWFFGFRSRIQSGSVTCYDGFPGLHSEPCHFGF